VVPENRKIDDFIESRLRQAALSKTSSDFTSHLMKRMQAEYRSSLEEVRRDRIAKYIVGSFCSLIIIVTVIIGYFAKTDVSSTVESANIKIEPTIENSANYFQQLLSFIQNFSVDVLGFFGLSISPHTINVFAGLLVVLTLFFLADKAIFKDKLRSIRS
jgi:hypothetical protein